MTPPVIGLIRLGTVVSRVLGRGGRSAPGMKEFGRLSRLLPGGSGGAGGAANIKVTGVNIKVTGVKEARELIEGVRDRIRDLRPAFMEIDATAGDFFRRQFETSGAAGNRPWAALSEATRHWRRRAGGNRGGVDRPLWDTGRLKRSLQQVGPESIRVVEATRYERGTRVNYATFHQHGFSVRRWGRSVFRTARAVPARQVVPDPFPKEMVDRWVAILDRYIETGR